MYKYSIISVIILILLLSCVRSKEASQEPQYSSEAPLSVKEYVLAIHPLHNPERLFLIYGPLIDYLNENLEDCVIRLEASRDYAEFDKKLYGRVPDFALPNPYQTLNSLKYGYNVIAKMGDDHKFTGVILLRKDSGINEVRELWGKKVSYPAPTALAATMMPQYYLQTHGLDVMTEIENVYVGSQESSILNVYLGEVSAGATWPMPWEAFQKEHPEKAAELELKWETEPLINNGVVARDDVPEELSKQIAELLNNLHLSERGTGILQKMPLSRFELSDNEEYKIIEDFLVDFDKNVRPLEEVRK